MTEHIEMPIAEQIICLAYRGSKILNKENAVADVNGYAAISGWCMCDRIHQR